MTRKTNWIVGEALALVVIAGSSTVATSALAEEPLTGPALEKASAAALEHLGGGTVVETEAGENGTPYQVEVRLEDGRTVEVALDANFKVIGEPAGEETAGDEEGASDQDEPGEEEGDRGTQKQGQLETIPQLLAESSEIAPESKRVDIAMPTFSNPTVVTNPLFPVSSQESVLLLGQVDGEPFRTEVILLPDTRVIIGRAMRSRRWCPSTSPI